MTKKTRCPEAQRSQEQGRALRKHLPRSAHGEWSPPAERRSPLDWIRHSNQNRVEALLPLRHARMLSSAFTFFRGNALLMAADLASLPDSGQFVQACGDAHLMNFGGYASADRRLVFDVNDFDETYPGPWEWDLKRLLASIAVAAEDLGFSPSISEQCARRASRSYRRQIRRLARRPLLHAWYARLNARDVLEHAPSAAIHTHWQDMLRRGKRRTADQAVDRLTEFHEGQRRLREQPPLMFRPRNWPRYFQRTVHSYEQARAQLAPEVAGLLGRYQLVDAARRVVGVGSVGTRCGVVLLIARHDPDDALILQYKEARPSVLQAFLSQRSEQPALCLDTATSHQGRRVVLGQRVLQAASDLFLGWSSDRHGRDFYFRQLRDMKTSLRLEGLDPAGLTRYGEICADTLARAHARSGDACSIGAYLGRGNHIDRALGRFAVAYAAQNRVDYDSVMEAARGGEIEVLESAG